MTLHIPSEYESRIRAAAAAAGYDDVETFVIEKVLGTSTSNAQGATPQGGQWKGQVVIADDFDELPEDLRDAFGMTGDDGTVD